MSEAQIKGPVRSQRPLSPHLQVYRLPWTAKLSILHRMSGIVLILGTLLVAAWLVAAVLGEKEFNMMMALAQTKIGMLALFGWSAALFYHMCSGIRHLFMDMGFLFRESNTNAGIVLVLLGAIGLTGATWYCAYTYHQTAPQAQEGVQNAE